MRNAMRPALLALGLCACAPMAADDEAADGRRA